MADDNFRSHRSRDPVAARSAEVSPRGQLDDPLAELARLIGQSDPVSDFGRDARHEPAPPFDAPGGGRDWSADAPEGDEPAQDSVQDSYGYNGRHEPRLAEPYPTYRPIPVSRDDFEADAPGQFSAPAPRFDAPGDGARYRDQEPAHSERLPAFLPRARVEEYDYDDEAQDGADDQAYALEDYDAEAPEGRRRGGFIVVAAVLGLAVLGTAGAFAYRAMFGASMLPSLPPIIKADNGPTKIVPPPNPSKTGASDQADAGTAVSGEKLVSREEQPVDMPAPLNPAPKVVSTIPIFPDPNPGPGGGLTSGAPPAPVAPAAAVLPVPVTAPPATAVAVPAPTPALAAPVPEPKKIRTVAIRPDQFGGTDAAPAAPPTLPPPAPSTRAAAAPPPRLVAQPAPRPAPPAPPPQAGANAPLSIVPDQGGTLPPPPPRTRTALAQPAALAPAAIEAAPAAGGGYAVQVSSQRSEAEAQAAFRALQAKFPNELGGRAPVIRRADLGAKGVYYRALVGPFASMEQAAQMCSSLKAAGGNCIVQRD